MKNPGRAVKCVWAGLATWASMASGQPSLTTRPSTNPADTRSASRPSRPGGEVVPPARREVPGRRTALPGGALYVPDFFDPQAGDGTEIVVWFLGAGWCAEQNFHDARKNAVLITINTKDFAAAFREPTALRSLLNTAEAWLASENITHHPVSRVCLGSFSGGYPAVREILKQPAYRALIRDVVLADSLYAPRRTGAGDELDPDAMRPFLDYAQRAARGECGFWFSHLYPPEERYRGNTTTLAARYLIDHLNATRQPGWGANSRGARLLYRADQGNFHVLGYAGMTNQDHFDHFYAAGDLIRQTSLTSAPSQR